MPLAILLALVAISFWSFLAFLGVRLSQVPSFLVVGIALTISGLVGMVWIKSWKISLLTLFVGVAGIFGYHFLYFTAFRFAPAIEANLINYLWPLLIVMLSPFYLPGYHLRPHHLVGACLGLAGASLILSGGKLQPNLAYLPGYLLMIGAAVIWASYSLLTKRLPPFPTGAVGAFCLASGVFSLFFFALSGGFSKFPLSNLSQSDWWALIITGLGPMGAAFYAWDAALKRGDPRVIGSLAYLTPLTSTLVLVFFAGRTLTWVSFAAMGLIVGGALIGSLDLISPRRPLT